ncbi:MBL fold metallo-hydrolase [Desmospora profundinema]|uniref:Glyoxylase-like metal-dependent hydrolase (Beta-lactamase superfamily II) n=1 Tax=Desmospora profundinema TaxID=1571184 RepID=A0ABU1IN25_9BACL|nr:MBL fold metallo-hydrolase [Desmospora profundinema]MDR6226181.1 glyoxylase-like metal-dependent hydrolase (beta-lactamase superfamily II) [Desmospora profundinema]
MSAGTAITVESTLFSTGYCRQIERLSRRDAPFRLASFHALAVLIRHPTEGFLLFDTGYATHFFRETCRFPYSLYRRITPVVFRQEDALTEQLRERGISPTDIRYVFLSHFHGDHIGGVRDFSQSVFICSREAYHHIRDKRGMAAMRNGFVPGLLPPDFSERVQFIEEKDPFPFRETYGVFDTVFDWFGDGSLLAIRLSGHAPGQYGLFFVDRDRGPTLLCADAAWSMAAIRTESEPHPLTYKVMGGRKEYRHHFQQLVDFHRKNPAVRIVPSHCPEALTAVKGVEA